MPTACPGGHGKRSRRCCAFPRTGRARAGPPPARSNRSDAPRRFRRGSTRGTRARRVRLDCHGTAIRLQRPAGRPRKRPRGNAEPLSLSQVENHLLHCTPGPEPRGYSSEVSPSPRRTAPARSRHEAVRSTRTAELSPPDVGGPTRTGSLVRSRHPAWCLSSIGGNLPASSSPRSSRARGRTATASASPAANGVRGRAGAAGRSHGSSATSCTAGA
jgi:hypothetical protein